MIEEKELQTIEQLIAELEKVDSSLEERGDDFLYRGQSNSKWLLDTTLERKLKQPVSLKRYYRFAYTAKSQIETFTEMKWDTIPTPSDYDDWVEKKDALWIKPFPAYEYLAYLRHHGYPSPLLDWTASPFIAIFFAFNDCSVNDQFVSIYGYLEHASVGKIRSSDKPNIYSLGPYAKIHQRHVLQQCRYTVCIELDNKNEPIYANHERVMREHDLGQDRLWKYIVPANERGKALKMLNKMNINAFSLFGSEDSLVETISTNEIIKNQL